MDHLKGAEVHFYDDQARDLAGGYSIRNCVRTRCLADPAGVRHSAVAIVNQPQNRSLQIVTPQVLTMKTKLISIVAIGCLTSSGVPKAQNQSGQGVKAPEMRTRVLASNTCTLSADSEPVWLWVFEELEENGDLASMLYDGKLERGRKQLITSGTERIRYSFMTSEKDRMHGNIGAWCYKGNNVRVP